MFVIEGAERPTLISLKIKPQSPSKSMRNDVKLFPRIIISKDREFSTDINHFPLYIWSRGLEVA